RTSSNRGDSVRTSVSVRPAIETPTTGPRASTGTPSQASANRTSYAGRSGNRARSARAYRDTEPMNGISSHAIHSRSCPEGAAAESEHGRASCSSKGNDSPVALQRGSGSQTMNVAPHLAAATTDPVSASTTSTVSGIDQPPGALRGAPDNSRVDRGGIDASA